MCCTTVRFFFFLTHLVYPIKIKYVKLFIRTEVRPTGRIGLIGRANLPNNNIKTAKEKLITRTKEPIQQPPNKSLTEFFPKAQ